MSEARGSSPRTEAAVRFLFIAGTYGAAYATSYLLLGDSFLPGGAAWALALLYLCSTIAGKVVPLLYRRLPPLLGMLAAGLLLRNIPGGAIDAPTPFFGNDFDWWSRWLRAVALAVIMLRAGLGLDLDKLRKLGLATARLAFLPCLCEALVVLAIASPLLDLPPEWGGTLGFVLAAVSPAVVVPGMLDLGERGYGVAKGVPTMVVAAASFDDVLAIAGFSLCLTLAAGYEATSAAAATAANATLLSASGSGAAVAGPAGAQVEESSFFSSVGWLVLKAFIELLAGIGFGVAYGALAAAPTSEHALYKRGGWAGHVRSGLGTGVHTRAVLVGALLSVVGGKRADFSGGGALGAIVLGATSGRLWPTATRKAVQVHVNYAWSLLQPALFGLLGAAVDVRAIEPSQLGSGLAVVAIALTLRILVTRLALLRSGLSRKEAQLVCVAWLPKATVQAAVGGAALDTMVERGYGGLAIERGRLVLMLSVLVILLTAPIGAIGIATFGPRWLVRDDTLGGEVQSKESSTTVSTAASVDEGGAGGASGASRGVVVTLGGSAET
jgi:NhaP-type Na+/H+ or K+/H+ antiporter